MRRRRRLGVALFGLALGCGETARDGVPRGDGGSPAAEQAGSPSGGRQPSPSGGVASDAGAGGNSQTTGESAALAGSGVTQAGSPAGGVAGTGGVAGAGEDQNKIVLFDGSAETFDSWYPRNRGMAAANPWTNNGDGTMTVKSGGGDIITEMSFTDVFVHVEYLTPKFDYSPTSDWHDRGASGVYLKGSYELVILDSFGLSADDGYEDAYCGAIRSISKPLVPACKMGGEWNAYDIEFRANVCTAGQKTRNAEFVEVKLNGKLIQQNVAVDHRTQAGLSETCDPKGVMLRDVSTVVPVSFRNIWAIPRN